MRIYFDSMTLPKKAARRIQAFYTHTESSGPFPPSKMSLSDAQAWAALLLGYSDWHELSSVTKSSANPPSLLDEDVDAETQEKRIQFQTSVLGSIIPSLMFACRELVFRFRVSAKNPKSESFAVDLYRSHNLVYDDEFKEWHFMPSLRVNDYYQEFAALNDVWWHGKIGYEEHKRDMLLAAETFPENFDPYTNLFWASVQVSLWSDFTDLIPEFEQRVKRVFPANFPLNDPTLKPLEWYSIENRPFLRSFYALGVSHYVAGNHESAKEWFQRCKKLSPMELGSEDAYLDDIRSGSPKGDIHLDVESDQIGR